MTTFDSSFEDRILTFSLRDAPFMQRVDGLIVPEYYGLETHAYLSDVANRHFEAYRTIPDRKIVIKTIKDARAAGLLKADFVEDLKETLKVVYAPDADLSNRDFYVDEVGKFARQRAMEAALEKSIDILEKGGDFAEIDSSIRAAQSVGAHEGTAAADFFDDVDDRVRARVDRLTLSKPRGVTTGHEEIDRLLFHKGWGYKELVILLGGAKSGKSTGLLHFALNAVKAGHKVLFTTHENSLEVTLDRMDAAVSGIDMKNLDESSASIKAALSAFKSKAGEGVLKVEEFPAGEARVTDIKRVIDKYAARGIKFDMVVCDYADELRPQRRYQDERFALKEVFTSLRALAQTEGFACLTATQTNRAGNKATTVSATDVGEDWNKMKICDLALSISSTPEESKVNQFRLGFALSRNQEQGMTLHCESKKSCMRFITKVSKVV